MADYKTLKELVAQDERFKDLKFGSAETGETFVPARGVMNRPSTSFAAVEQEEDEVAWIENFLGLMRDNSTDPVRVERAVLGRGADSEDTPDPSLYNIRPLEEVIGRPSQTDLAFNRALDLPEGYSPGSYAMVKPEGLSYQQDQEQVDTSNSLPSNIDFSFIGEQEGDEASMYVPTSRGQAIDSSGPTIGMGVDLGQRSAEELEGLPEDLRRKLEPYTNLKGQEAVDFVRNNPLTLTDEERQIVNAWSKQQETERLIALWERDSDIPWEDLTTQQATAVASVMYQYGSYRVRTPNFWNAATSGDWGAVEDELRNFGDKYGPRRLREANYLAGN